MNPRTGHDRHREKAQFDPKPFVAIWAPTLAALGISWMAIKETVTIMSVLVALSVSVVVGVRQWKILKREEEADTLMELIHRAHAECDKASGGTCPLGTTLKAEFDRLERKR